MDINIFKDKLFSHALKVGFTDCELYFAKGKVFTINVYKGEVEKYTNSSSMGASFRGLYNGIMTYSYTEIINDNSVKTLIDGAKTNASILSSEYEEEIFSGDLNYKNVDKYNESINLMSISQKIDAAKLMEKACLEYDPRIVNCTSSVVSNSEGEVFISNTKGLELHKKSNFIYAYVSAIAKDGNQTKSASEIWADFSLDTFDPIQIAQKSSKKAISYLGAKTIFTGSKDVCIENKCFAEFLSAFVSNFYAESVQKGFSLLKGKVGMKVASENITIVDEPLLKNGYSSTSFDSEGVASYDKVLVENGVLNSYLYNLKSAKKDGVKSTGNGFKSSYKSPISTSTTNFYIKNGSKSFQDMIQNITDGVLITSLSGLHSGTNSISGDFSLLAEGFLIQDGKISSPVEQITVAGNFYNLLKGIKDVSDDLKFLTSGIGSPSIFVGSLNISGN